MPRVAGMRAVVAARGSTLLAVAARCSYAARVAAVRRIAEHEDVSADGFLAEEAEHNWLVPILVPFGSQANFPPRPQHLPRRAAA
mmetsp:Transcript_16979/g.32216  ORF Transcript_16979/g.32216 Transcript_16979/m.32216 type:complete len:85 (+) Transcript_16979:750-1004(+)